MFIRNNLSRCIIWQDIRCLTFPGGKLISFDKLERHCPHSEVTTISEDAITPNRYPRMKYMLQGIYVTGDFLEK
ncbi:MAG: hypothetical protein C4530_13930 [Desulfobacteraceae bacterium]|nr:MAG: hypothetical protein C4530_13930 [Desulfobacteraceae bacterium]